ncbi:MAG: hypothetical protein R3242_03360 [Akkermansiaceae bacterium]|nr:hypothetical protein [Akkermansiaceae bacterium]
MSLKGFHIVFITVASLLCAFLVLWSFVIREETNSTATAIGIIGIIGLLAMPLYGWYFLRKAQREHLE